MKKQTWMLIGLVVVLFVVYLLSRTGTPVKREADYFVKFDSVAIQKVEIHHQKGDVTLEKRGDQWWVVSPIEYPANPQFGDDMAGKLADLKIENLITEQPEKQEKFELTDTTAITVTVHAGGEPATFLMGKISEGYRHTYMRLADSDKIYLVKGVYKSYFSRNVKDWRDRTICDYNKEDFRRFVLKYPDKSMELTNVDTAWIAKIGREEFVAKKSIVDRLVNMCHNIKCFDFVDSLDTRKYDFSKPAFELDVSLVGDQFTMKLLPEDDEATKYIVEKSDALTHFIIYQSTAKALMKEFDEFRPGEDEEEKEG
jgi:hypothetical protein